MAEIGFYHLTRHPVARALPPLLGRTLQAGKRAVVRAGAAADIATLDQALWLSTDPDWLPHGTEATGFAADQPIWLTTGNEVPNGATFLFLIGGVAADPAGFERVFDLFDGNDPAAVAAARERWAAAKAALHDLTYWQQTEGGWTKKR